MSAVISQASWLNFARAYTLDGVEVVDAPELPEIVPQLDDIEHVFSSLDRLDLLADRYYRDPRLDWLILVANNKIDLVVDFTVGEKIRIPSPRYILADWIKRRR